MLEVGIDLEDCVNDRQGMRHQCLVPLGVSFWRKPPFSAMEEIIAHSKNENEHLMAARLGIGFRWSPIRLGAVPYLTARRMQTKIVRCLL